MPPHHHGRDRPAHALGSRVVLAVPDVPDAAREAARRAAADARDRPVVRAVPARRADRDPRRLPRGATGSRGRAAPARRRRDASRSGRGWSRWTSSWCRARRSCATCSSASHRRRSYGGAMPVGYLPDMFGHVAQMPQLLRLVGHRARGRVARHPGGGRQDRRSAWSAPDGSHVRVRVPVRLVLERSRHPRGRQGSASLRALDYAAGARERAARRDMLLMNGTDHQMPQPWLGPGRRRGQRAPGRLPLRRHVAARVPRATADRRAPDGRQASCARARAPTC